MLDVIQARLKKSRTGTGPKYQALRDAILGAITSEEWEAGMRLPTEVELSRKLPFSLGTIQKAYGQLVKDGLVVRSRGRGSFVAPMQKQMAEPWHCRFLGDDGTVLPVYPRLIGHQTLRAEKRWSELFGRHARIVRIDRLISINHEFDVLSQFYATDTVARALLDRPRKNVESANFKAILLREFGMPISRIVQTIGPADSKPARALRWRPQLVLEATAYTVEGEIVYFQEIFLPPAKRKLLFDSDLAH
jgi:GntR family transcriptional regulator